MDKPGESSRSVHNLSTIPLYLVNGTATVWDAQTAATLHCVHNISGIRAGTLPGVAQQNTFLGLPLTLMQEETAYLVTQGIAHLVALPETPLFPSVETVEAHTRARIARLRIVEAANREAERIKHDAARAKFKKGGDAAQAKREARAQRKAEEEARKKQMDAEAVHEGDPTHQQPPVQHSDDPLPPSNQDARTDAKDSAQTNIVLEAASAEAEDVVHSPITGLHFHTISGQPVLPRRLPDGDGPPNIITSVPHPLFPFPRTPRDHALLATFTDLLARSLRVGLGPRFGGEYLVYPGDYLRYHAHFTSQVLVRDEPIRPTELVAWGRLGTGTKKAGLICAWDDGKGADEPVDGQDEGRIDYYSLEWANFG